jgi:hypothetical protein
MSMRSFRARRYTSGELQLPLMSSLDLISFYLLYLRSFWSRCYRLKSFMGYFFFSLMARWGWLSICCCCWFWITTILRLGLTIMIGLDSFFKRSSSIPLIFLSPLNYVFIIQLLFTKLLVSGCSGCGDCVVWGSCCAGFTSSFGIESFFFGCVSASR